MAPPKRSNAVIVILILVAFSLISFSLYFKSPEKTGFFKKIVLEAAVPLGGAVNSALGSIAGGWERYVLLVGLGEKNRELEEKVASLTRQVNDFRELSLECIRLWALMDVKNDLEFPSVAARVVGKNRLSVFQTVLINKGTVDGLETGFPVVAAQGVAGRIIDVSWNVSKVLLLVDYNSNIDALIQRTRYQGVLQGAGRFGCALKYVQSSEDVQVGDVIISSGLAGIFPKGLLLGTVAEVEKKENGLFQRIKVQPTLDIAKLEEVLVITKKRGDDR